MEHNSRHDADYRNLSLELILPSEMNPRKNFDPTYIEELAKSMKRDGQWDPIIVRKNNGGMYELIAGECRLRAAKSIGLKSLRARVLETTDEESLLLALKTNVIRHNLNPVEEANALTELARAKKDLKEVIKALNKSRTWISNRLKLAQNATEGVRNAVLKEELPLVSAIKITELPEGLQGPVASKAIRERLNTKEVEKLVELFKKTSGDAEVEFLLRTPVKDYMRSVPYISKKGVKPRFDRKKPSVMRCECGSLYIIDWTGGRIVSEKVLNHEFGHNIKDNSKILE